MLRRRVGFVMIMFLVSCGADETTLIPTDFVETFLQNYSDKEKPLIRADHQHIENVAFSGKKPEPQGKRIYLATVGAPGSCKSTILETYMASHPDETGSCVYVDPDQRTLKFMTSTYWQSMTCYEISTSPTYQECAKNAYNKWRGASNYIANSILNKAYREGFSIAHGTTSQCPEVGENYKKLKSKGYKITLLVCMSEAGNRLQAVKQREEKQGFVQSTPKDFVEKEKSIMKNFPIYFEHADVVHIYWVDKFNKAPLEVGAYSKEGGWSAGKQPKYLKKIMAAYNANKTPEMPAFDELIKRVN